MTAGDLFALISDHDVAGVAAALASGADPNGLQDRAPRWRPLHAALEELESGGSTDVIVLLLRHGADVDGWDDDRDATPLLMAFFREQWAAVRLLAAAGASMDTVGSEGDTPLLCAVETGDLELIRLVLLCGPGATLERPRGLDGDTPLGLAVRRGDVAAVRALLAAGANPNTPDADYRRALERLPERTDENAAAVDEIAALLRSTRAQPF
ncbi:ankyrin repeat domain-containing protein [Nocardia gipuzkoensis]|uniref:ankyrin repeat domain-containing protein n=1 Tax=Nocardia gipuzkoensis TaxID=2749991 RepID=UPI001E2F0826|nr:ankyrin repeat domain-containing protein [Nocardia gipuzkoensis]UGT67345.1 ankyrin repeat domain-containing protein [Nocardia gipuzkoensis]